MPPNPRIFVTVEGAGAPDGAPKGASCGPFPRVVKLALRHRGQVRQEGLGAIVAFDDGGAALRFVIALRDGQAGGGTGMRIGTVLPMREELAKLKTMRAEVQALSAA
jgi:hypothetical protein